MPNDLSFISLLLLSMPRLLPKKRILAMLALILAGEAIFFLPFILPRVFRHILMDVFQITNLELGTAFSAYGFVAMVSYFFGGPIADRVPARNLMTFALLGTAAGGFFMATIPSYTLLIILYAFWGMTTILLFWAALIRATREWGNPTIQGKAFGFLDGGRGLSAALISTLGVTILSSMLTFESTDIAGFAEKTITFQYVILTFSVYTLLTAIFLWFALPSGTIKGGHSFRSDFQGIKSISQNPTIWLHAIILLCGYVGYKVTDDFSLYARDVIGLDDVKSAGIGAIGVWLRPVVAIAAGMLADRYLSSRLIIVSFTLMIIGGLAIGSGLFEIGIVLPYVFIFLFAGSGAFAMRVLYYSVLEEARVPLLLTGTTVGVISIVGYTPDIFMGPLMGWLIDSSPGAEGHRHVFLVLALVATIGLVAAILFRKMIQKRSKA